MELVNLGQNFSISNISMEFLTRNKDSNLNNCYGYSLHEHLQNGEPSCNLPVSNLFFHNISRGRTRGEVPFMIPRNIRKKFENFTRYINSKDHCVLRETIDHLNVMSSNYSNFINSPRGYSDVSNSIASYLIGGFVGSKSQVNNEKHRLSYDLGGAILKTLQDCKCDRQYDKLREKFEINKFGKKLKSKDSNGLIQDVVLCKNLINNNDIETEPNLERIDCLNEIRISAFGSIEMEEDGVGCRAVSKEQEDCDTGIILTAEEMSGEEFNQQSENNTSLQASKVDNEEQAVGSADNEGQSARGDQRDELNQSNLFENDERNEPSVSNVLSEDCENRERQNSESSTGSSDSDSFIVFDDNCFFDPPSSILPENEESDYLEDDSSFETDEDDDDFGRIDTSYEWDVEFENREVIDANARWYEFYGNVEDRGNRRVRFNDEVTVHRMVTWDFAYRAARVGPWEQMAHDRQRFSDRIIRLSFIISPILDEEHRSFIYDKLYG